LPYIANTEADRKEMLDVVGLESINEMWEKAGIKHQAPTLSNLPSGKSEFEVTNELKKLSELNASELTCFVGGGFYDHIIPAAVGEICSRSEFYTAYTPYQPEASQGTLQSIYEYQSAICRLTGLDVSNASMYDGGTALFEAMMMAVRITGRRQAVISKAVSPIYRKMIECYSSNLDVELVETEIESSSVSSCVDKMAAAVSDKTACVIAQYPNFMGCAEDWKALVDKAHEKKVVAICSVYPTALSVLKTPGEMGFDIVTGEGQSLGIPLSFGGPYLGFMAVREKYMRKMPGRICGRAVDSEGKTGFVLTLQAREQHIRRENAMSNICSNENLCALTALAYLSCVGKQGFLRIGELCESKAVFARQELLNIKGVQAVGPESFFNEFVIKLPGDASEITGRMIEKGFAAGFPLGRYYDDRKDQLLIAVTEKRTREEIKAFANAMEAVLWN